MKTAKMHFKHKALKYPQTPESAYAYFYNNGICISEWARSFNFPRDTVTDVLRQRCKGNRGTAHQVAVALGFKPQPKRISPQE